MKTAHLLRMTTTAAVAVALFASVTTRAAAQGATTTQAGVGKIEVVGGTTYDWGTVEPGQLKTELEVKNLGPGTLNIKEVRPSCGCTSSGIDKKILGPGEVGKVSITLNANTNGPITKYLNITSDDPTTPLVTVNLKANIRKPFDFVPTNFFSVLNGKVGVEQTVSVKMSNISTEAFTLHAPKLIGGNVTARFDLTEDKEVKPGESVEITMHVTPQKAGPIGGTVEIATSVATPKRLDITGNNVVESVAAGSR